MKRLLLAGLLAAFCFSCARNERTATPPAPAEKGVSTANSEPSVKGGKWQYNARKDEMDDKTQPGVFLQSENQIRGFLGNNDVQPVLGVACRDADLRVAVDVQVPANVEWGGGNTVRIRFDDDPPRTEKWVSGTSTGMLFSKNPSYFVERLKTSKKFRLEYTQFAAGSEVAIFNVQGFDYYWPQLKQCASR